MGEAGESWGGERLEGVTLSEHLLSIRQMSEYRTLVGWGKGGDGLLVSKRVGQLAPRAQGLHPGTGTIPVLEGQQPQDLGRGQGGTPERADAGDSQEGGNAPKEGSGRQLPS